MEPHLGRPWNSEEYFSGWNREVDEIFSDALRYVQESEHHNSLQYFRQVKSGEAKPHHFWSEYIWTVFASGFNAKVLTKKFKDIMDAVGPWDYPMTWGMMWKRLRPVLANERKARSVNKCRMLMQELGWDEFQLRYCSSVDTFRDLPFIGNITKHHIARNLGFDTVKPDIHLERLADHFQFYSPEGMCSYLSGLSGERVGVVDFILWAYAAAFGTSNLR